ncbi:MAG: hypothetical protein IJQ32_07270 [Paludibacteraceae bacterium]|nr:hypothetical protein [Paludibacteraceae bacterium]
MKKLFIIAAMICIAMGMQAQGPARVPAYRGIIERVQPNGDTLRTYLRGDERKHWMMTEDGWQIFENDKKWYVYAQNKKSKIVKSRKKAHNADDRCKCEKRWLGKHGVKKEL